MEGATTVTVVRPPLDAVVEAREATFEEAPENTVGGGHIPSPTRRWVYALSRTLLSALELLFFEDNARGGGFGCIYTHIHTQ